jgi:amidase
VRIVSDGVVTRSVRDTAAFFREAEKVYRPLHLPPIGDLTRPGRGRLRIAVSTVGVGRGADAEVSELTLKVAAQLEELGHHVEQVEPPVAETFPDDFILYWSFLALVLLRTGRRLHGRSWDPSRLDSFTLGLAAHSRRNLHRLPRAIRRLRRSARDAAAFYDTYDVALTPTLATETPEVGRLDPTRDYASVLDRVMDWVAFTPLQNATGDPAISLPLATTANGLPQGMMFGAAAGREATLIELAYELEDAFPFARIDG